VGARGPPARSRRDHARGNHRASIEPRRLAGSIRCHASPPRAPVRPDGLIDSVSHRPSLANKVCIVTGSTSGIGVGIAEYFVELGARVVVHGREDALARAIVDRLRGAGGEAAFIIADLADVEACRRVVRFSVERYGGVDVLVNNAASTARGYLEDAPVELWDAIMHVNLRAPVLCLQEAVKSMKTRGGGCFL